MKTKQKLLILCSAILISLLPACIETVHKTTSAQPEMSVTEAKNSLKVAINDTTRRWESKVVTNFAISDEGITLFYDNNAKKYYAFNDIPDPAVNEDVFNSWVVLKQSSWGDNYSTIFFKNTKSARRFADALYYLKHHDFKKERELEQEDCLRLSRQTPIDLILAGTTADGLNLPCSGVPLVEIESILNENLVEWKSKGLRERLQKSSSGQLSDLVVKMEKGILKLDLKVKELKDAADEDARQVQAPGQAAPAKQAPGALKLSHLLDQRKTLLMVILGSVKQAAAQRATGG